MKSNLQFISTQNMNYDAWLRYRKSGVGASEVGAILGLSPYSSSIELFYDKIGEQIKYNPENIFMFMGKEQEAFIAKLWQYWDGSEEGMMANYRAGTIVRRCQRVKAYVRNPRFPWLFVSLDRKINKYDGRGEGALEIKTIGGYEADKWEGGIPPSHVVQVQTQCAVLEFIFGELATLKDGRRFDVIPFDVNKEITEAIIDQTGDFWKRVTKARELLTAKYHAGTKFNYRLVDELTSQLAELEPSADNSTAYADFITSKFDRSSAGHRSGTLKELNDATRHKEIGGEITALEDKRRLFENKLKRSMGDVERLTFGDAGFVSWKSDVNGARRFINKIN
jgi:putative phage-type endonuclease